MPLAADGAPSIHSAPPGEACTLLSSRPEGLTREEVSDRLRRTGPNVLRKPRGRPFTGNSSPSSPTSWRSCCGSAAASPSWPECPRSASPCWGEPHQRRVRLLAGAQGGEGGRGAPADPSAARPSPKGGGEAQIPAEELVRGHPPPLRGDHVSADARVIAETELRIDQSTLTGESHPVRKMREAVTGPGSPAASSRTSCSPAPP